MRHSLVSIFVCIATLAMVACRSNAEQAEAVRPTVAPGAEMHSGPIPGADSPAGKTGKVVETMNSGGYTYVLVDDGSTKIWAAAPQFSVAVGNEVVVPEGSPMTNFFSKTLNRTFDVVYFVGGIQVAGSQTAKQQAAVAHGGATAPPAAVAAVDVSNVEKAAGGYRVAELYADKAALAGKEVVIRGKAVKVTSGVMGKNWIHLRDGTGSDGTNDLTMTTSAVVTPGNMLLVRGKLSADKDFGSGYKYDVIIEDAVVTVE